MCKNSKVALVIARIIRRRYGCGVPLTDSIEPFRTPHGLYGIFISQEASIGENCVIYQQVTVGSNNLKNSRGGYPVIGNNCLIGAGAKIIGGVIIGNDVRIGANTVIVQNIPDSCTVVLEKPRVIQHNEELVNEFLPHSELLYPGGNSR